MKNIFNLILNINFSGSIWHRAAMLFFLLLSLPFYVASSWTNIRAVETVLAEWPSQIVLVFKVVGAMIDPIIWFCFTLAFVAYVSMSILKREDVRVRVFSTEDDFLTYRNRVNFRFWTFAVLTVVLAGLTWSFSHLGGGEVARHYAYQQYHTEGELAAIDSVNQFFQEKEEALTRAFQASLLRVNQEIDTYKADSELTVRQGEYAKARRRDKGIRFHPIKEEEKRALIARYEQAKTDNKSTWQAELAHRQSQLSQAETLLAEKQTMYATIRSFAVNIWSIFGLLFLLINANLTIDKFRTVAFEVLETETMLEYENRRKVDHLMDATKAHRTCSRQVLPRNEPIKTDKKSTFVKDISMPDNSSAAIGFVMRSAHKYKKTTEEVLNFLDKYPEVVELVDQYEFERKNDQKKSMTLFEISTVTGKSLSLVNKVKDYYRIVETLENQKEYSHS
jgi:hypothetical protein